mgnify:CR=1 FL=1
MQEDFREQFRSDFVPSPEPTEPVEEFADLTDSGVPETQAIDSAAKQEQEEAKRLQEEQADQLDSMDPLKQRRAQERADDKKRADQLVDPDFQQNKREVLEIAQERVAQNHPNAKRGTPEYYALIKSYRNRYMERRGFDVVDPVAPPKKTALTKASKQFDAMQRSVDRMLKTPETRARELEEAQKKEAAKRLEERRFTEKLRNEGVTEIRDGVEYQVVMDAQGRRKLAGGGFKGFYQQLKSGTKDVLNHLASGEFRLAQSASVALMGDFVLGGHEAINDSLDPRTEQELNAIAEYRMRNIINEQDYKYKMYLKYPELQEFEPSYLQELGTAFKDGISAISTGGAGMSALVTQATVGVLDASGLKGGEILDQNLMIDMAIDLTYQQKFRAGRSRSKIDEMSLGGDIGIELTRELPSTMLDYFVAFGVGGKVVKGLSKEATKRAIVQQARKRAIGNALVDSTEVGGQQFIDSFQHYMRDPNIDPESGRNLAMYEAQFAILTTMVLDYFGGKVIFKGKGPKQESIQRDLEFSTKRVVGKVLKAGGKIGGAGAAEAVTEIAQEVAVDLGISAGRDDMGNSLLFKALEGDGEAWRQIAVIAGVSAILGGGTRGLSMTVEGGGPRNVGLRELGKLSEGIKKRRAEELQRSFAVASDAEDLLAEVTDEELAKVAMRGVTLGEDESFAPAREFSGTGKSGKEYENERLTPQIAKAALQQRLGYSTAEMDIEALLTMEPERVSQQRKLNPNDEEASRDMKYLEDARGSLSADDAFDSQGGENVALREFVLDNPELARQMASSSKPPSRRQMEIILGGQDRKSNNARHRTRFWAAVQQAVQTLPDPDQEQDSEQEAQNQQNVTVQQDPAGESVTPTTGDEVSENPDVEGVVSPEENTPAPTQPEQEEEQQELEVLPAEAVETAPTQQLEEDEGAIEPADEKPGLVKKAESAIAGVTARGMDEEAVKSGLERLVDDVNLDDLSQNTEEQLEQILTLVQLFSTLGQTGGIRRTTAEDGEVHSFAEERGVVVYLFDGPNTTRGVALHRSAIAFNSKLAASARVRATMFHEFIHIYQFENPGEIEALAAVVFGIAPEAVQAAINEYNKAFDDMNKRRVADGLPPLPMDLERMLKETPAVMANMIVDFIMADDRVLAEMLRAEPSKMAKFLEAVMRFFGVGPDKMTKEQKAQMEHLATLGKDEFTAEQMAELGLLYKNLFRTLRTQDGDRSIGTVTPALMDVSPSEASAMLAQATPLMTHMQRNIGADDKEKYSYQELQERFAKDPSLKLEAEFRGFDSWYEGHSEAYRADNPKSKKKAPITRDELDRFLSETEPQVDVRVSGDGNDQDVRMVAFALGNNASNLLAVEDEVMGLGFEVAPEERMNQLLSGRYVARKLDTEEPLVHDLENYLPEKYFNLHTRTVITDADLTFTPSMTSAAIRGTRHIEVWGQLEEGGPYVPVLDQTGNHLKSVDETVLIGPGQIDKDDIEQFLYDNPDARLDRGTEEYITALDYAVAPEEQPAGVVRIRFNQKNGADLFRRNQPQDAYRDREYYKQLNKAVFESEAHSPYASSEINVKPAPKPTIRDPYLEEVQTPAQAFEMGIEPENGAYGVSVEGQSDTVDFSAFSDEGTGSYFATYMLFGQFKNEFASARGTDDAGQEIHNPTKYSNWWPSGRFTSGFDDLSSNPRSYREVQVVTNVSTTSESRSYFGAHFAPNEDFGYNLLGNPSFRHELGSGNQNYIGHYRRDIRSDGGVPTLFVGELQFDYQGDRNKYGVEGESDFVDDSSVRIEVKPRRVVLTNIRSGAKIDFSTQHLIEIIDDLEKASNTELSQRSIAQVNESNVEEDVESRVLKVLSAAREVPRNTTDATSITMQEFLARPLGPKDPVGDLPFGRPMKNAKQMSNRGYLNLILKQIIKDAADNGVTRIAIPHGEFINQYWSNQHGNSYAWTFDPESELLNVVQTMGEDDTDTKASKRKGQDRLEGMIMVQGVQKKSDQDESQIRVPVVEGKASRTALKQADEFSAATPIKNEILNAIDRGETQGVVRPRVVGKRFVHSDLGPAQARVLAATEHFFSKGDGSGYGVVVSKNTTEHGLVRHDAVDAEMMIIDLTPQAAEAASNADSVLNTAMMDVSSVNEDGDLYDNTSESDDQFSEPDPNTPEHAMVTSLTDYLVGKQDEIALNIDPNSPLAQSLQIGNTVKDLKGTKKFMHNILFPALASSSPIVRTTVSRMAFLEMEASKREQIQLREDQGYYDTLPRAFRKNKGQAFFNLMDKVKVAPSEIDTHPETRNLPPKVKRALAHFKARGEGMRLELVAQKRSAIENSTQYLNMDQIVVIANENLPEDEHWSVEEFKNGKRNGRRIVKADGTTLTKTEAATEVAKLAVPNDWGYQYEHIHHAFFGVYRLGWIDEAKYKEARDKGMTEWQAQREALVTIGDANNYSDAATKLSQQRKLLADEKAAMRNADGEMILVALPDTQIPSDVTQRLSTKQHSALLAQLGEAAALTSSEIFDLTRGIVGTKKSKNTFYAAMLERTGAEGYSTDFMRVWGVQTRGFNRYILSRQLRDTVYPATEKMRANGLLKWANHFEDLVEYVINPASAERLEGTAEQLLDGILHKILGGDGEKGILFGKTDIGHRPLRRGLQTVRAIMYFATLKSVRQYIINSMQPLQTVYPLVGELGMMRAIRLYNTNKGRAILRKYGPVADRSQYTDAPAGGGLVGPRAFRRITNLLRQLVQYSPIDFSSENRNQRFAFLALYLHAKDMGMSDEEAVEFGYIRGTLQTQYPFTRTTQPPVMRGPIAATILQYKRFMINQVQLAASFLARGSDKGDYATTGYGGFTRFAAMQLLIGGVRGVVPIALFNLGKNTLCKFMPEWCEKAGGYPEDDVEQLRRFVNDATQSDKFGNAIAHGIFASIFEIDMSGSISLFGKPYGRSTAEQLGYMFMGPAGNSMLRVGTDLSEKQTTDRSTLDVVGQSLLDGAPAVSAMVDFLDACYNMEMSGKKYYDNRGRFKFEATVYQRYLKMMGFRTMDESVIAAEWQHMDVVNRTYDYYIDKAATLYASGKDEEADEVVNKYNAMYGDRIPIEGRNIRNRVERKLKDRMLPAQERRREQMSDPAQAYVQEQYGEVE